MLHILDIQRINAVVTTVATWYYTSSINENKAILSCTIYILCHISGFLLSDRVF